METCSLRDCQVDFLSGHLEEALVCLTRCLEADPALAAAYSLRAGVNHRLGRHAEALEDITRALELRPGHLGDRHNRGVVLTALGREAEAIRDYEAVLAQDPTSAGTMNNLAWLLATARDPALRNGPRALELAQRAVAANRSAAWLDTLATAAAECGDFDRAVALEEEAYHRSSPPNPAFARRLGYFRRGLRYTDVLYGEGASSPGDQDS